MNQENLHHPLLRRVADLGALRIMLGLLALAVIIFAPDPNVPTEREGWGLFVTGVMPAVGPMVFMVALLDAMMSRVMMVDKEGEARRRYQRAMRYDLGLALVIFLSWLPLLIHLYRLA